MARGSEYTLPEISAFVLRRAKAIAESAIGETVDRAVITVPANFNDLQRGATKTAGRLAGLEVAEDPPRGRLPLGGGPLVVVPLASAGGREHRARLFPAIRPISPLPHDA